ncbi:lysozyme inhibitor LprI family protein [Luteibacter sp.]|uniref:lysozyme inhibitor LprI family protein n=1 Tax=Luteibacter sp. TaxID=1886636 RepID=UPI003F81AEB3
MRSRKTKIAEMLLVAACFLPLAIRAQELPDDPGELEDHSAFLKLRPGYQDCLDAAGGVVPTMIRCNSAEYTYQDKRLNMVYGKIIRKVGAEDRRILVDEERKWIAKKEKDCALPGGAGQGDILDASNCLVLYTARRATALERRLGD